MIWTIFVFALVLSVLVLVHELGHFWAAKKAGIKVLEFGLGYPPRIWGKKIGETLYSLNWIPYGGFVRLLGQDRIDERKKKGSFWAQRKRARILVLVAGVICNYLLAVFLFAVVFMVIGLPRETDKIFLIGLAPGSPAETEGLELEDQLIFLNNEKLSSVGDFIEKVALVAGEPVELVVLRGNEEKRFELIPRENPPEGEGALGVTVSGVEMKRFPFWQMPFLSFWEGIKESYAWVKMILAGFGQLLTDLLIHKRISKEIAGPLGIFQLTSQVSRTGLLSIAHFVAILSLHLAILNILPIPGLDGGWLLFVFLELVTREKSQLRLHRWFSHLGMAFLVSLVVLITANDLRRVWETMGGAEFLRSVWPF